MRLVMVALLAIGLLAAGLPTPVQADQRTVIMAPVLRNTSLCPPGEAPPSRVSTTAPGCCTEQAGCAAPLPASRGTHEDTGGRA